MSTRLETLLLIGLGAVVGANLRYLVIDAIATQVGRAFPWGTLLVNIAGSFGLAVFVGWMLRRSVDPRVGLVLATGFFGAFTTFSTYATESIALAQNAHWAWAAANVVLSNLLCLAAVVLGLQLGRSL